MYILRLKKSAEITIPPFTPKYKYTLFDIKKNTHKCLFYKRFLECDNIIDAMMSFRMELWRYALLIMADDRISFRFVKKMWLIRWDNIVFYKGFFESVNGKHILYFNFKYTPKEDNVHVYSTT